MASLSPRLATLLSLITPCRCLADIGSDHCMLLTAAVERGIAERGVAVEINHAPFAESQRAVLAAGLEDRIEVCLGDGLAPLDEGTIDALCIAGMGGGTMARILARGESKLVGVQQLVLQPNVDAAELRQHLLSRGYAIVDDRLVEDGDYIYQVLRAERGGRASYSPLELEYGRHNLNRQGPLLSKLLSRDLVHWLKVRDELAKGTAESLVLRRSEVGTKIALLAEALASASSE